MLLVLVRRWHCVFDKMTQLSWMENALSNKILIQIFNKKRWKIFFFSLFLFFELNIKHLYNYD